MAVGTVAGCVSCWLFFTATLGLLLPAGSRCGVGWAGGGLEVLAVLAWLLALQPIAIIRL